MTSDLARAVKGSPGFLNGPDPCKDPGRSVLSASVGSRVVLVCRKACRDSQIRMGIGNENDQAS